jgi:hypothetical protein
MLQFKTTHEMVIESIDNVICSLSNSVNNLHGDITPQQQNELDRLLVSISELITAQVNQNISKDFTNQVEWGEGLFSVYYLTYQPYQKYGEIREFLYQKYGKDDCTLDSEKYHGEIWLESDRIICEDDLDASCIQLIRQLSYLPIQKF